MIMKKSLSPVIVFSFSKRECEANAMAVSKVEFNDGGAPCSLNAELDSSLLPPVD